MASFRRDIGERLRFVRLWAEYIKKTPNKKWSQQQNMLINSVMKSSDQDVRLYLKVKKLAAR
jgi:hypothetical protein